MPGAAQAPSVPSAVLQCGDEAWQKNLALEYLRDRPISGGLLCTVRPMSFLSLAATGLEVGSRANRGTGAPAHGSPGGLLPQGGDRAAGG